MADEFEFDWEGDNTNHLAAHNVTPAEFEYAMSHNSIDTGSQFINSEYRYRSIGVTPTGRMITMVWTFLVTGKVRAVTAFTSGASDRKLFLER